MDGIDNVCFIGSGLDLFILFLFLKFLKGEVYWFRGVELNTDFVYVGLEDFMFVCL